MNKSDSIGKIMPALLKAQSDMGGAKKGASNPFFKSRYADLGAVLEACKDLLNDNGITILQPHGINANGQAYVETVLVHSSGEYIGSQTLVEVAKKNDPQALGSAITYARRYGLQSLLSMPAEDDDGESAMNRNRKGKSDEHEAKEVSGGGSKNLKAVAMGPVRSDSAETVPAPSAQSSVGPAPEDRAQLIKKIGHMAEVATKQKKISMGELKTQMSEKYKVSKKEELTDDQAKEFYNHLQGIIG